MSGSAGTLKVVHLWRRPGPMGGGGGVLMDQLHRSLLGLGVDSTLFCVDNPLDRSDIRLVPSWPRTEKWLRRLTSRLGLNDIHRISSWSLSRDDVFRQADVIHIHGLHSGFLSYLALPHLTRDKPAVFTLHDVWPLTGHCAVSFDCQRWKTGCGKCPYPDAHPAIRRDATRIEWRLKRAAYRRSQIVFAALNNAQMNDMSEGLPASFSKTLIPGFVDTEVFHPVDRTSARKRLGITSEQMVIMFTATHVDRRYKGGHHLLAALGMLPDRLRSKMLVLALGNNSEEFLASSPSPGIALPFTEDKKEINLAFNAADVLAFPSLNETFGLVWAEALAAGTPVVSFDVGGAPDHLIPGKTGIVVPSGDVKSFAAGICQVLDETPDRRNALREASRGYALSELSSDVGARRHLKLYESLL